MINKYTNKQRGLLAVIMAMVMVFAGAAFVAAEVDAESESKALPSASDGVITITENGIYSLNNEVVNPLIISAGIEATINLNSYGISTEDNTAITNYGTLTIIGSGKINTTGTNTVPTVLNNSNSTMVLKGGIIDRDNTSSYYTIENKGEMTIFDGVKVETGYTFPNGATYDVTGPSLVRNVGDSTSNATMIIQGGEFISGLNTIKNESSGTVTINGGTFSNENWSVLMNYGVTNINGGTFTSIESDDGWKPHTILNRSTIESTGILNINGGTFNDASRYTVVAGNDECSIGSISIGSAVTDNVVVYAKNGVNLTGFISFGKDKLTMDGITAYTDVLFTKGSVGISGTFAQSGGEIRITGIATITDDVTIGTGVELIIEPDAVLSIPEDMTLTFNNSSSLTVSNGATLNVAGSVITNPASNPATLPTYTNNGTITILDVDAIIPSAIAGSGTVDTSAVASEGTLSGTYHTDTTFTQNQTITASGDITLVKGTEFAFEGMFIIPEGVTLTIEDGAQLLILKSTGKLVNNGTIIVESSIFNETNAIIYTGALVVENGAVENNGTIDLAYDAVENHSGWVMNIMSGSVINNGSIIVGEDSEFVIDGNLVNNGTIDVQGEIIVNLGGTDTYDIDNAGEIILSGQSMTSFEIHMISEEATVIFDEFLNKSDANYTEITISDEDYLAGKKKFVSSNVNKSSVVVSLGKLDILDGVVVGVQIQKDAEASKNAKEDMYLRQMIVSGEVSVETTAETGDKAYASVQLNGNTAIIETLMMEGTDLIVNGIFAINGTLSVVYDDETDEGTMTIEGGITTITGTASTTKEDVTVASGTLNAVGYVVKETSKDDVYFYTTLSNAVASGTEKAIVYGSINVDSDITVPGTMTIDNDGTTIVIAEDVTLTLASGAVLKNVTRGLVDVKGTLVIEDVKKSKITENNVSSEVKSAGENTAKYTNLVNALNLAVSGDTVKLRQAAEITKNVTIAEGVTLETKGMELKVNAEKTLTIDGTLYVNGGSFSVVKGADSTIDNDDGKVVLNNLIKSDNQITADGNYPAGAYYSVTEKTTPVYCVMPVEKAVTIINDVDDSTLTLMGKLNIGDISVIGTSDSKAVIVLTNEITMGTITLDFAEIQFAAAKFIGEISNESGNIALEGTATSGLKIASTTKDDVKTLTVTGGFTAAEKKVITATGEVSFLGFVATPVVVDGNVKVIATSTIEETEIEDLTVNGSVLVDNEATLTVGVAQVLGTLTVADETDDNDAAGTFDVGDLFLGIVYKDVEEEYSAPSLAATATLVGDADISNLMYVIAGSSFPEDLIDENTPAVELYVEGELWMTIYSFGTETSVTVDQIPVENVKFEGWATEEGKTGLVKNASNELVPNTDILFSKEKYYADIKYDVYEVKFVIAEGIDDVYLDGILVKGSSILGSYDNQFVSAGIHTISYTLANGYTGEAKMLVDGKEVSGYTFTTEGEYEGVIYTITLQGIEKAPAETGSVVEEEGMDLTDILLIVLVVLIVIMAIIVALRMMRS